jgi:exosortase E/protease (VPEID-CTERM system)
VPLTNFEVAETAPGITERSAFGDPARSVSAHGLPADAPEYFPRWLPVLIAWLAIECLAVGASPHTWNLLAESMAAPIAFCLALLLFGRKRLLTNVPRPVSLNPPGVWLHLLSIAALCLADFILLGPHPASETSRSAAIGLWYAAVCGLAGSAALAIVPRGTLLPLARRLGAAWLYAALSTALAMIARSALRASWNAPASSLGKLMQDSAIQGTLRILKVFYPTVIADAATATVGTPRFQVEIAAGCSGIEGLALMLALTVGWIAFTRKELRLARAVWLVPLALTTIWLLNLIRLAALIAIGDAGYPDVAIQGFHSEAGWIFFNTVAIVFLLVSQRVAWLRRESAPAGVKAAQRNPPAIYLIPFLAITAASLVTRAASSGFDWLYPVRFLAALLALWWFRAEYRRMDWRCGWTGPLAGAVVFLMWLGLATGFHFLPRLDGHDPLAHSLALLSPAARLGWLTARVLAAVVTVPVAEELCFRGFLARRLSAEDFEQIPFRKLSLLGIAVSSIAFGALHGRLWLAGTLAGVVFALCARLRSRLGEAVAAHATANLLIAIWVLGTRDYSLW